MPAAPLHLSAPVFSAELYKLYSKQQLQRGDYVAVKGRPNTYGVVLQSCKATEGRYLNVVRGCRPFPAKHPKTTL